MVVSPDGRLMPPPKTSRRGEQLMSWGMTLALTTSPLVALLGCWFKPLFFLFPLPFFGFTLGLGGWGIHLVQQAQDRYQAFQKLEQEYKRDRWDILNREEPF